MATEFEIIERMKARARLVDGLINAATIARADEAKYYVEAESGSWEQWREIEQRRKEAGWELAPYGQHGNMLTMSGYWRKAKAQN